MTVWQYAQLRVIYGNRPAPLGGKWTVDWHGPDATRHDVVEGYGGVVAELGRAGAAGWEVVDVATSGSEDSGHSSAEHDWSLTRYTFRRPHDFAANNAEHAQQDATTRSPAATTSQPEPSRTEPATETATLVRLTAYWLADSTTEGPGLGPAAGRVLIRREAAQPRSPAEVGLIALFRAEYQDPGISADRRDRLKAAAADYAASVVEGQFGVTWWATPQSFPLSQAADLLNGSADWLRGLVEHPLAGAASTAGAAGPLVPIGAGITAGYVTAPLTTPLGEAARACEIAGIVIGLVTGTPSLVMASVKRLAHDEAGQLLSRAFEQVISPSTARQDPHADPVRDIGRLTRGISRPEESLIWKELYGTRDVANDSPTQRDREHPAEGEKPPWHPYQPSQPWTPAGRWDMPPPKPQTPGPPGPEAPEPPEPGTPGPPGPQRPGPSGPGRPGP